jgi:PAS domain-containing protein
MQRVLDNALSGIATDNYEMPLHHKNGDRIEILLNANPQKDDSDNVYGVVGVGQDITERKKAENNWQRAVTESQRLIERANAPIFGINQDGLVNEWNRTAAKITGFLHRNIWLSWIHVRRCQS